MIVFGAAFLVLAGLGVLMFQSSLLLSCLSAGAALSGILWRKKRRSLVGISLFLAGGLSLFAETKDLKREILGEMERIDRAIEKGDFDGALERAAELEEHYGPTDALLYVQALYDYENGQYQEANACLNNTADKERELYYILRRAVSVYYDGSGKEDIWILENADARPHSFEAQRDAGFLKLQEKDYLGARYYFSRAYELEPEDVGNLCALGAVNTKIRDLAIAEFYLTKAKELGTEEEMLDSVERLLQWIEEEQACIDGDLS